MADPDFNGALSGANIVASESGSGIDIVEISDLGMIDIRVPANGRSAFATIAEELGFPLPQTPRTSASGRGRTALWWSVDQWLVTCAKSRAQDLAMKLDNALGRTHSMVTNVSDARTVIRVSGGRVREILMKGSSIDLLARDISAGYIRRTQIAEVPVALYCVSEAPFTFDIYIFRSYADYIWQWLTIAGRSSAILQLYGTQSPPPV